MPSGASGEPSAEPRRANSMGLLANHNDTAANSIAWSHDGRRVAFTGLPGMVAAELMVLDGLAGSPYRIATFPPYSRPQGIAWSADDRSSSSATSATTAR